MKSLYPFAQFQIERDMMMADSKKPLPSRWECANCSLPEQAGVALRPCSRCKLVRYCGTECQAQHWKKGGHKMFCVSPDQRKPQPAAKEEGGASGPTCAICIEAMVVEAECTRLACSHVFHARCVVGMQANSSTRACPVCRAALSEAKIKVSASQALITVIF